MLKFKSDEAREAYNSGAGNPNARRVRHYAGCRVLEFDTVKEAAEFFGVTGTTITNWIRSGKDGFSYA